MKMRRLGLTVLAVVALCLVGTRVQAGILNPSFENGAFDNWTTVQTYGTWGYGETWWKGTASPPDGSYIAAIAPSLIGSWHSVGIYQVVELDADTPFTISVYVRQATSGATAYGRVFNTAASSTWVPASEADFTATATDGWTLNATNSSWQQFTSPTLTSKGRLVLTMYSQRYGGAGDNYLGSRWDLWGMTIIPEPATVCIMALGTGGLLLLRKRTHLR